jgi:hypothetical protein
MPLEDYYRGDGAFVAFATAIEPIVRDSLARWNGWGELVALCRDDEALARAVFYAADEFSLTWMNERPPVLEGMTAIECLDSPTGLARLKEALMRSGGMM